MTKKDKRDKPMSPKLCAQMKKFGQRLKNQRDELGITQKEVGTAFGTSQRVQSGYERGVVSPKISYLYQLETLGFDIQRLLVGSDHKGIYVLTPQEQTVMDLYRQSRDTTKLRVLEMLAGDAVGDSKDAGDSNTNIAGIGIQSIKTEKKQG